MHTSRNRTPKSPIPCNEDDRSADGQVLSTSLAHVRLLLVYTRTRVMRVRRLSRLQPELLNQGLQA